MILEVFPTGPLETNAYLLGCEKTHKAVVIDVPLGSADLLVKKAKELNLTIEQILLTHSHWDHFGDVVKLKNLVKAQVKIHKNDAPNLVNPGADGLKLVIAIPGLIPDGYLEEGEEISVGELKIKVIHTPGHSPGGVSFYLEKEKVLFSGDTLFQGTIGRLDLATGNSEAMWASLKKLARLPSGTQVFPGHGGDTTIGEESWIVHAKEHLET